MNSRNWYTHSTLYRHCFIDNISASNLFWILGRPRGISIIPMWVIPICCLVEMAELKVKNTTSFALIFVGLPTRPPAPRANQNILSSETRVPKKPEPIHISKYNILPYPVHFLLNWCLPCPSFNLNINHMLGLYFNSAIGVENLCLSPAAHKTHHDIHVLQCH